MQKRVGQQEEDKEVSLETCRGDSFQIECKGRCLNISAVVKTIFAADREGTWQRSADYVEGEGEGKGKGKRGEMYRDDFATARSQYSSKECEMKSFCVIR